MNFISWLVDHCSVVADSRLLGAGDDQPERLPNLWPGVSFWAVVLLAIVNFFTCGRTRP